MTGRSVPVYNHGVTQRRFNASLFMVDRMTRERFSPIGVRLEQGKIVDSSEHWMVRNSKDPLGKLKLEWPQWDYELEEDGGVAYYAALRRDLGLE